MHWDPDKALENKPQMVSASNPEKRIPKYCNGVLFNKLSDGSIILTLVTKENVQLAEGQPSIEDNIIIEKIIVDKEHAKKIAEKLNELTLKDND